jgi:hypothetical protein
MFSKLRNKLSALHLLYLALTCPRDEPAYPGAFRGNNSGIGYLLDARGMWHGSD